MHLLTCLMPAIVYSKQKDIACLGSRFDITAIIYDKRGRVLSIGKNSYCKTHPLQHHHACKVGLPHKQFLHAISRCKHLHKAHRISVLRFDAKGKPCNAKPCPVCASAISAAGIKIVEHT